MNKTQLKRKLQKLADKNDCEYVIFVLKKEEGSSVVVKASESTVYIHIHDLLQKLGIPEEVAFSNISKLYKYCSEKDKLN